MSHYNGISGQKIKSVFPGCLPCKCYDNPKKIYKVPRYSVDFAYTSTWKGNGDRKIREVRVECDCCGSYDRYDVEDRDIWTSEISW